MDLSPTLKGLAIGVAVAAPVGPMSVLCMRRTLARGWGLGIRTGLGIATGDATYALVAGLGLASVTHVMLAYDRPLHVAAGAFLVYLGMRSACIRTNDVAFVPKSSKRAGGAYASALLLTLTNPSTIVSFAAIFTVLAPSPGTRLIPALLTVLGVFTGSALWWLALVLAISSARRTLGNRIRRWIDIGSGATLVAFGIDDLIRAR